jgi:hypothetical protein
MTIRDPEVLFELRDEPELLAIADALADVVGDTAARPVAQGRRRFAAVAAVALAAAAVIAGALLLRAGDVEPTLVDRALAAVGDQPVLHAVIRQRLEPRTTLVQLSTGEREVVPRLARTELWFDDHRGVKHVITQVTGEPTRDELYTPEGVTSESGPVWTCARIAAHPVEATRAGVSCNFNGDNGETPRQIPEEIPTVDPALEGFLDGYRAALASGAARQVGEGTVDGQHVYWLELRIPDRYRAEGEPPADLRERVAVASDSYRPLLVRPFTNGEAGDDYEVLEIGTMSTSDADFSEPKLVPPAGRPTSADVRVTGELELAEAAEVLGAQPLWAGPELDGLKLAAVQRQEVTTGYGRDSGVPPQVTPVIALVYGGVIRRHPTAGSVVIMESTVRSAVWWGPVAAPPTGYVSVNDFGWGNLRVGDVYVSVRADAALSGVQETVVEAARKLLPVPSA